MPARLERSLTNRVWTGVCGGIAEYFQVDASLVRALFVIATIFTGGLWLLAYIALVILMPLPGRPALGESRSAGSAHRSDTGAGPEQTAETTRPAPATEEDPQRAQRRREAVGFLLIALGLVFLLANLGAFRLVEWRYVWPIALIAFGAFILIERSRR